jgi:2-dehydro-3-deoxy-L-rhamnonate dehydrogenase (NAD+)
VGGNPAGRVAIVTGGAGGFGRAIAARLGAEGVLPVLWDIDASSLQRARAELGVPTETAVVDVTDADAVEAATAELAARHGRIDVLVNNAGVLGPLLPTWETAPADFRRVLEIDLVGAFQCSRAVVPVMLRPPRPERRGRIVNIASIQGKEGMHLASAYSAAKAGLIALTKSLARELAREGILVNCVTPAASMTAMGRNAPPERLTEIRARIPMDRFLEPDELAVMVAWLASDACSFSTGAVFDLSGGRATY